MPSIPPITVGRSPACDVCLRDRTVSAHHAVVTVLDDGRIHVSDLGSRNGTFVVQGDRRVRVRDRIVERSTVLIFGTHRILAANLCRPRPVASELPQAGERLVPPTIEPQRFMALSCNRCGRPSVTEHMCRGA